MSSKTAPSVREPASPYAANAVDLLLAPPQSQGVAKTHDLPFHSHPKLPGPNTKNRSEKKKEKREPEEQKKKEEYDKLMTTRHPETIGERRSPSSRSERPASSGKRNRTLTNTTLRIYCKVKKNNGKKNIPKGPWVQRQGNP